MQATKHSNITKNYTEKELTLSVEGHIDTITSQELEKEIEEAILSEKEEAGSVAQQGIVYAEEKMMAGSGEEAV